jgi:hypothetical protein
MLDQPDHILSTAVAQSEALHGEYNFLGARYLADPYHVRVIVSKFSEFGSFKSIICLKELSFK